MSFHFPDLPAKILGKKWRGFISNRNGGECRSTIKSKTGEPLDHFLSWESGSRQLPKCLSQVSSSIHSYPWFAMLFVPPPELLCVNYLWVCLLIMVKVVVWVGFFCGIRCADWAMLIVCILLWIRMLCRRPTGWRAKHFMLQTRVNRVLICWKLDFFCSSICCCNL